jgi:hypothetical protein
MSRPINADTDEKTSAAACRNAPPPQVGSSTVAGCDMIRETVSQAWRANWYGVWKSPYSTVDLDFPLLIFISL